MGWDGMGRTRFWGLLYEGSGVPCRVRTGEGDAKEGAGGPDSAQTSPGSKDAASPSLCTGRSWWLLFAAPRGSPTAPPALTLQGPPCGTVCGALLWVARRCPQIFLPAFRILLICSLQVAWGSGDRADDRKMLGSRVSLDVAGSDEAKRGARRVGHNMGRLGERRRA